MYKMSVCLLIAFVINAFMFASGDFNAPKWKALRAKCIATTGMDEMHIENAKQGQFTMDESFKNYLKCLMDEENLWNADDTINVDAIIESIPEKLRPVFGVPVRECCNEIEHDPQQHELAYRLAQCVYSKTLDKFDLP